MHHLLPEGTACPFDTIIRRERIRGSLRTGRGSTVDDAESVRQQRVTNVDAF